MTLQGVILDVDGTLVSSNDAHAQAYVDAFTELGYDVPFERIRPLIGMGSDQLVPQVVPELKDEEGKVKAISERRKELIMSRYGPPLPPANGARQLILHMQQAGLRLMIASSATSEEMQVLLKAAQVEQSVSASHIQACIIGCSFDQRREGVHRAFIIPIRVQLLRGINRRKIGSGFCKRGIRRGFGSLPCCLCFFRCGDSGLDNSRFSNIRNNLHSRLAGWRDKGIIWRSGQQQQRPNTDDNQQPQGNEQRCPVWLC